MKDKASHVSSVVYEGKCNCGKNYIGETGRNVTVRWDEHSDIGKNSEPAKHLNQYIKIFLLVCSVFIIE